MQNAEVFLFFKSTETTLKLIFTEKTNNQLDGVEKDAKTRMRKNARKRQSTIKCS